VVDSHPLIAPVDIPVPAEIAAMEAEVAGRWLKEPVDDEDTDPLTSH
jgi:nitrous oxidase accessory protein